jgi:hypothetical protein
MQLERSKTFSLSNRLSKLVAQIVSDTNQPRQYLVFSTYRNWLVEVVFPPNRQLRNLRVLLPQHLPRVFQDLLNRKFVSLSQLIDALRGRSFGSTHVDVALVGVARHDLNEGIGHGA